MALVFCLFCVIVDFYGYMFAFVVLDVVFQDIGYKERLRNDLVLCRWNVKINLIDLTSFLHVLYSFVEINIFRTLNITNWT